MVLEVTGLQKKYGDFCAVKNLNLQIPEGKTIAFLGPNGAGKTTSMKMMAGILQPDQGTVQIAGYDLWKQPLQAKKNLGFVPDRPFLYEKLSGREMLSFILNCYQAFSRKDIKLKVVEILETVGMTAFADELIENYSHGMKQRIAIACGVIHKPKLLIIDEPMVGLDPHGYRMLFELLKNFKQEGGAIFLSTHTLPDAAIMADEFAIIKEGELIPYDKESTAYKNLEEFYFHLIDQNQEKL